MSRRQARSFLGRDPAILDLLEVVERVAATDAPVLLCGETGTGKELLARHLHQLSPRATGPCIALNCGAIAPNLEESELFGHVAGAFTGAVRRKQGKFEAADNGTLLLDEAGEMSPGLQVKLLRVLANGEYSPVGMAATRRCDVRVVAATNRDLGALVTGGSFRADLYYRLNVFQIEVPPLRQRPGDIPLLAEHFLRHYAAHYGRPKPRLTSAFEERLLDHDYPGNVRELENLVHRALVLSRDGRLGPELLPADVGAGAEAGPAPVNFHQAKQLTIERFEREYLTRMLRQAAGIVSRAAARAGLSERNFHEKLSRYGIDGLSFRPPS